MAWFSELGSSGEIKEVVNNFDEAFPLELLLPPETGRDRMLTEISDFLAKLNVNNRSDIPANYESDILGCILDDFSQDAMYDAKVVEAYKQKIKEEVDDYALKHREKLSDAMRQQAINGRVEINAGAKPGFQEILETKFKFNNDNIKKQAQERIKKQQIADDLAAQAQRRYTQIADARTGKSAQESARIIQEPIRIEVKKRIYGQVDADRAAEKAQRHFNKINDSSAYKSAKASAEIIEKNLINNEAKARIKNQEIADKVAEQAQKHYAQISDATTGKSAQESAKVIQDAIEKIEMEAKERIKKQQIADDIAAQAQKHYTKIADATTGKSAQESAQAILEQTNKKNVLKRVFNNLKQTLKTKISSFLKKFSKGNLKKGVNSFGNKSNTTKNKFVKAALVGVTALASLVGLSTSVDKAIQEEK